jgi:CO/xanthine dehydrogenase FAD-binding subunit
LSAAASCARGGTSTLPTYPETAINIKTIPGLDYVKDKGSVPKIGGITRLAEVAMHPAVKPKRKS